MARLLISEDQICESGGYKKQDQHYDRHDIADHETVQTGTFEMLAISFYLSDDPVRSDYPADQNTGQQRNKRHQEAVADVVHDIKKLSDGTIWKAKFEVQFVVSETDQNCGDQRINTDSTAHFFARFMVKFHTVSNQSFHDGNAGCQRRKAHHQEERDCDRTAEESHGIEDFGQ